MATRRLIPLELVALFSAFAVLAMIGLVAMRTEEARRLSGALVRHALQVQSRLDGLYGQLRRAESEERGYIITRDPKYLEPYEQLEARINAELKTLGALLAENPAQVRNLTDLRPLIAERLSLLKLKVDMMRAGKVDEVVDIVQTGHGKEIMDRIDALVARMGQAELAIYQAREQTMESDGVALRTAIIAVILAIGGVGGLALFLTHRQLVAINASRNATQNAYDKLMAETARRESVEAQLRQSQKLEAIGQLTGGIAHDFNNMLAVIVASLNILRRKLQRKDEDWEMVIDSALDGADRASNLVKRLLAFARMQPLEPKVIDINKLVSGMTSIIERSLGSGVVLRSELSPDALETKIDPHELENVLLNLAVNARDAMPNGGRLTIETKTVELDEQEARQAEVAPGKYVMLAVTDTGEGMPPEVIAKAFDPFFTTKPVGKGTGLGLSQVHGFVKQSGGHVTIHSEPQKGASIRLYLPRYLDQPTSSGAAKPRMTTVGLKAGATVLLAEDEEPARIALADSLRELGYVVLEAEGGSAAIRLLKAHPEVAMLVTDIVMPTMDGVRLAREATFRRPDLHVLFVTGYSRSALVHNGILDPVENVLAKPFTLDQLSQKIRDMTQGAAQES